MNPVELRKAIEAVKVMVIDLQASGSLGDESEARSVDVFSALDQAWLAACKLIKARDFGR